MNWWRHIMAMELRKILAFRSDFWITFLGQTLIQVFIATALWRSIFHSLNVTQMNGLTLNMMTLYYLIVPLGNKVLSGENIGFLAREIYDGTFSRYLIYPLSAFEYKSLTYLTHSLFYAVQLIFLLTTYIFFFEPNLFSIHFFGNLLLGTGIFLVAAVSYLTLLTCIELFALWADNIWSLSVMLRFFSSFLGGGFIPLSFFPSWAQEFVVFTPFPYFISLPIRTIMGVTSLEEVIKGLLILTAWILIFQSLIKVIWKRGQLRFSGVGQ